MRCSAIGQALTARGVQTGTKPRPEPTTVTVAPPTDVPFPGLPARQGSTSSDKYRENEEDTYSHCIVVIHVFLCCYAVLLPERLPIFE